MAGMMFVMGGLAMIVGYGVAGGVDGGLPPGTPFAVRLVQSALGLGIAVSLGAIASWVAFGPGVRHFTATGPFVGGAANETLGRTVFGIGALLVWVFVVAMIVVGVKRLRRRSVQP